MFLRKAYKRQLGCSVAGKPYMKSAYRLIIKALELNKLSPVGESGIKLICTPKVGHKRSAKI